MDKQEFQQRYDTYRREIEAYLKGLFTDHTAWGDLYESMRYSLLAGGKRIRPALALEFARLAGMADWREALPAACAVELVHTYSLIHDDLPCMDDDDLRRGRPTNHRVYGEATAVLAGDGLLTAAFQMLTARRDLLSPEQMAEGVDCLSRAAGPSGMVGGQVLDMAGEGRSLSLSELELLQSLKTGALISAAAELGCIAAGGSPEQRRAVARYAQKLGRAFQIRDDMLDVTGTTEEFGKPVGSDRSREKSTFVTALGLEGSGALVEQLTEEAVSALNGFPQPDFLIWLARELASRRK